MPVVLDDLEPLAWDSPHPGADTQAMLGNVRPNIPQPHVRDRLPVRLLHLRDPDDGGGSRAGRVPLIRSARKRP
ncbi:hypothetical protein GCM10010106_32020 [Thermopolyspora flexuosa]|jgi:hypothetical protein|uniref:Uncharacterized protein n=1 Tax=Thermopolyspora flexuosa TaxID=103836 RepID=A0A543ISU8_9ACTN|nr:hypothetical protein [Thermopolyspora flexuosa]TQM73649.1 hypothetical protein FHX40_0301 [Thermopolyspora flexuosa]GGM82950.1 hypothetical protein GCM10010106_32020 [Thermopolyspora flexuosa]